MAYIYKIQNKLNGKIYVGKTLDSPQARWHEHIRDYQRVNYRNRPLYKAFAKYGVENFEFSVIEQCSEAEVNEREVFWIEMFGSFKTGYNATLGGDGKHYCDYDLIFALYDEGKTIKDIVEITQYDPATCRKALENRGITKQERIDRGRSKINKTVLQIDVVTNQIVQVYPSIQKAYESLGKTHSGHIAAVCTGKRKTAYGYKWKYFK